MQSKLTVSYVVVGLVGCLAAILVARQLIRSDFTEYVSAREFALFKSDLADYAARHGGLDKAMLAEPFGVFLSPVDGASKLWQGGPFRFLVMDERGTVLHPAGPFKVGQTVSGEVLERAEPVTVGGRVAALVAQTGAERLTEADAAFMGMTDASMGVGMAVAAAFVGLFGLGLAWRQSAAARDLVAAVRLGREQGGEPHRVEAMSDDELGELADAYNAVNEELARCRGELDELAVTDPQTNLYNRRHFDEQARQFFESAKRYDQPLSVMMGSLDRFRALNETFTREVGDLVLEKVAELFSRHTRKSDVVARYGDEDFVVLFTNTARERAAVACENIRQAVERYPWDEIHPELTVTVSMGLAGNGELSSAASMVARAEQYLAAAKAGGRNRLAGDE
ncbi:GGDEF domain-containing protein [Pseudodesulfovibrio thermohalotolerans]|uniref:GGDEF domain-containing protein n=1 Tax=Pseudodesulfovibrio thermohalotolerans TaxID=2880651 RepID=UPI0024410888|nr:GGDEF domain-containing protein [Pseudodesulfovibrio thermohalotolerans]WFS62809.1 GGDEF domain-containing protein [Pseudodesulfovibrio thermohalotolerans]